MSFDFLCAMEVHKCADAVNDATAGIIFGGLFGTALFVLGLIIPSKRERVKDRSSLFEWLIGGIISSVVFSVGMFFFTMLITKFIINFWSILSVLFIPTMFIGGVFVIIWLGNRTGKIVEAIYERIQR